jgi:hypothetical protein
MADDPREQAGYFEDEPFVTEEVILGRKPHRSDVLREAFDRSARQRQNASGRDNGGTESATALIPLTRMFPIDDSSIPTREWGIPGLLMRRHVTVLVAPPGSGKSLLTIQVGLACAVQMEWAGWRPRRKFRVLFINSEDDKSEMERRHFAAAVTMKIDQGALREQVTVVSETTDGIVIAKYDNKQHSLVRTPLLESLVATIIAEQIDIVFVDPFAETFDGDENSNNELKWAAVLWREVARRTGAAVCLVHHTKKYASGMAGDMDAARGAGALVGIARVVATVFTMTMDEAQTMGVPEEDRIRYIRYDDAKANQYLITRQARWFRKDTFTLNNATEEDPADQVGVLVPWKPAGLWEGIAQVQIDQLFAVIDRGMFDAKGQSLGEYYTLANNQKDSDKVNRWVGLLVTRTFGIDDERAKKMLAAWAKDEGLVPFRYRSRETRKWRTGCGTPAKKAEIEGQQGATVTPLFQGPIQPGGGDDDDPK